MEIKVPEVGESVYEGLLVKWHRKDGEMVHKDDPLCEIETDKITIELNADADGILAIRAREGKTVKIGSVIGVIDESSSAKAAGKPAAESQPAVAAETAGPISPAARKMVWAPSAITSQCASSSPRILSSLACTFFSPRSRLI